jgi:hypothetical protein
VKSKIGRAAAWDKDASNPYVTHVGMVKKEGSQVPCQFSSPSLAMNFLVQELITDILANQDKTIVWREFPAIHQNECVCPITGEQTTWYWAAARWSFE